MLSSITETPQDTIVVTGDDDAYVKSNGKNSYVSTKLESDVTNETNTGGMTETVVIKFADPDPDNPFDWATTKKWCVTVYLCYRALVKRLLTSTFGERDSSLRRRAMCVNTESSSFHD